MKKILLLLIAACFTACVNVSRYSLDQTPYVVTEAAYNAVESPKYVYLITDYKKGFYLVSDSLYSIGDTLTVKPLRK